MTIFKYLILSNQRGVSKCKTLNPDQYCFNAQGNQLQSYLSSKKNLVEPVQLDTLGSGPHTSRDSASLKKKQKQKSRDSNPTIGLVPSIIISHVLIT